MAQVPEAADPPAPPPSASAQPSCATCGAPSKYRCPACDARSCSAACVAAHKSAPPGCTGKRPPPPRPAYVPLSAFDDATLAADVALLQAIQDATTTSDRRGGGGAGAPPPPARLPVRLRRLEAEARRRGVALRLQPPGMSRRTKNSTRYDKRTRTLHWHVEWRFHGSGGAGGGGGSPAAVVESAGVAETDTLAAALSRPGLLGGGPRPELVPYADALSSGSLTLRLRLEGGRAGTPAWAPLDPTSTLGSALAGRTVLEFPTVAVLLPGAESACPV